jgi:hypothetical protein
LRPIVVVDFFRDKLATDRGRRFWGWGDLIQSVLDSSHTSFQKFFVRLKIQVSMGTVAQMGGCCKLPLSEINGG